MKKPVMTGNRVLMGTFGTVWWNGVEVFEVESFEARVKIEREGVTFAGSLDEDSKIKGLKGEGKLKVKKVFSRGLREFLQASKDGVDIRSQLIAKLKDPDTINGQAERVSIDNVWFDEYTVAEFEMGKKLESEFPFGFTPSSVELIDEIVY